jgi:hypothetical protein
MYDSKMFDAAPGAIGCALAAVATCGFLVGVVAMALVWVVMAIS